MSLRGVGKRSVQWIANRPRIAPNTRRAQLFGASALVVLLAGSGTQLVVREAFGLPDGAAFQVGDRVISEGEYQRQAHLLKALYGVEAPPDGSRADQFRKQSAKAIAVGMVVDDAAAQQGVQVSGKQARDYLDKYIEERFPQGREQFTDMLGQNGISEKNVLGELKKQLATGRLFENVTRGIKAPTSGDLKKEYERRKRELVKPEKRRIRNIVVASRKEADEVLRAAQSGRDFGSVARERSLDGKTKDKGGDLGYLTKSDLQKNYSGEAFKVKQDALFGPVKTKDGWNVGYVSDIKPETQLTLAEIRDEFRESVHRERKMSRWDSWLTEQIRNADVTYAEKYQPKNPDQADGPTAR